MTWAVIILISIGFFFLFVAGIGAIRLPDFFTRSHAVGVTDTLGTLLIVTGLAFHYGLSLLTVKLLFVVAFIYIANPTVTHILTRAAHRARVKVWSLDEH